MATLPDVAVSVAVCVVVTADAVAVNAALVAPDPIVTVAGTLTAELLLLRLTVIPALGAAAVSETVQASVPAPAIDALVHASALRAAVVDPVGFFRLRANVLVTLPAVAVSVADVAEDTAATLAENDALVPLAPTVTVAGMLTAELLLESVMLVPVVGAGAVSVTVQLIVAAPVTDELLHATALSAADAAGAPFPAFVPV